MPVMCPSLKEVFWKTVSIAYHRPLPLTRAYFSLRSATGFIYWEGRKKSALTTLTGPLSVGHSKSSWASLCEAFSVQACILPKALIPFLHSFRASQHPEFLDKEMNWFIWITDEPQRGSSICYGIHSNLKRWGNWPWMLEGDIKGRV